MESKVFEKELIKDLIKSFWDERGKGARYRTTLVGLEYFQNQYGDKLEKDDWKASAEASLEALKEENLVKDGSLEEGDRVLKVDFQSCFLKEVCGALASKNVPSICCPCANVVMHFMDRCLDKDSELVSVEMGDNTCTATLGLMGNSKK